MSKYARGAFAVLLGLYLALAVSYSLADPVYESTDELRHFRYVRHLIVYRELPVQREGAPLDQQELSEGPPPEATDPTDRIPDYWPGSQEQGAGCSLEEWKY